MGFYALKTTGDDPRFPSEVIEADGYRRFARVVVFLRGGRDGFEIPAELVGEIQKFTNRIDAETWLSGSYLAPGRHPDAGGRRWQPPADLPSLVPGPGKAPSRKLTATPLSAVLDLSKERVAVSPTGPHVETVDVRLRGKDPEPPAEPASEPDASRPGSDAGEG